LRRFRNVFIGARANRKPQDDWNFQVISAPTAFADEQYQARAHGALSLTITEEPGKLQTRIQILQTIGE
jgi:hypothetical protein